MLFCYVYILDPCKGVDCGSGLKCEPAERSYSCRGKAEICLPVQRAFERLKTIPFRLNVLTESIVFARRMFLQKSHCKTTKVAAAKY